MTMADPSVSEQTRRAFRGAIDRRMEQHSGFYFGLVVEYKQKENIKVQLFDIEEEIELEWEEQLLILIKGYRPKINDRVLLMFVKGSFIIMGVVQDINNFHKAAAFHYELNEFNDNGDPNAPFMVNAQVNQFGQVVNASGVNITELEDFDFILVAFPNHDYLGQSYIFNVVDLPNVNIGDVTSGQQFYQRLLRIPEHSTQSVGHDMDAATHDIINERIHDLVFVEYYVGIFGENILCFGSTNEPLSATVKAYGIL